MGERFRSAPPEFTELLDRLRPRLAHVGYLPARDDYLAMLRCCDLVISSAIQENFGIAVLEAIASGCQPVAPNRLAYPEVIPAAYHRRCLYDEDEALLDQLRGVLTGAGKLDPQDRVQLAQQVCSRFGVAAAVDALDMAVERLATGNGR